MKECSATRPYRHALRGASCERQRIAGLVQILLLLANLLVIILLIASAASAILGERVNASIIVLKVGLKYLWR